MLGRRIAIEVGQRRMPWRQCIGRCVGIWVLLVAFIAQAEEVRYQIDLIPSGSGVTARYRLTAPADSFRFDPAANQIRSRSWHLLTPGLLLEEGVVRSPNGHRFNRFEVHIGADAQAFDRTYPVLQ